MGVIIATFTDEEWEHLKVALTTNCPSNLFPELFDKIHNELGVVRIEDEDG